MTRIERRVFINCAGVGVLLTLIVLAADVLGWLQVPETWMYDQRARHFQFFAKPPTDQLVHLDIDDKALEGIGRWPWPRSQMAEIMDEIHIAGAKAVGLDILFADPQAPSYEPIASDDGAAPTLRKIDHDALLADSVRRAGNVLLPGSFILAAPATGPLYATAVKELAADVELTELEVTDRVRAGLPKEGDLSRMADLYLPARREAVYQRIAKELATGPKSKEELRSQLIKRRDDSINSPLSRAIDEQYERVEAMMWMTRFGAKPVGAGSEFIPAKVNYAPVTTLSKSMAATAFVDFKATRDGVLRWQPLMLECQGKLFPQFGFSLALLYLGATPDDVSFSPGNATVRCPDGQTIVIPVSRIFSDTLDREVPVIFNIPWFGHREWETMYDWPAHRQVRQHLSMNTAWEPVFTRHKIVRNNANARRALAIVVDHLSLRDPPASHDDDPDANNAFIDDAISQAQVEVDYYKTLKPDELTSDNREFAKAVEILRTVRQERALLKDQFAAQRGMLRDQLSGKAVLVGFTATGKQDAVPTSVHASCPGVVTHGAIFNAIITGHFWSVAPRWITIVFTIALGLLTAVVAWRFSPLWAFLITSAFGMGYVALNGVLFFDHLGQVVGLAAPQIAMGLVWSGCSLARIVVESSERHRIIRRFRSYVDPTVVNYMMERPDEVRMEGETRELTVCFSDIAGFTTLSERLGHGIVPVLNEFMDLMVPVIRTQRGTVDKFLGDGIMFFFGAPIHNANHASDAATAALLMQEALARFNDDLKNRGLPTVKMRIGVSTGTMVVGDAGSKDASDYTVLGDAVNFGSRLESANKMTGTSILISARTAELLDDRFLVRPVGALQVVGKSEGLMTYEVCGFAASATTEQRRMCEQTYKVVHHYRNRAFTDALLVADEMDASFGPSALTILYRQLAKKHIETPPPLPFDGTIVFTEK